MDRRYAEMELDAPHTGTGGEPYSATPSSSRNSLAQSQRTFRKAKPLATQGEPKGMASGAMKASMVMMME